MSLNVKDEQYLDHVDLGRVPDGADYLIETHRPTKFRVAYHNHASVEVNFLDGCEMEYAFPGCTVHVPQGRMTVFWGAVPHSVTSVSGPGQITNLYLSFSRVRQWGLPIQFTESLFGGEVLCCKDENPFDRQLFQRWLEDGTRDDDAWQQLVLGEIENRFRRMALEGTNVLGTSGARRLDDSGTTVHHVSEMLQYIADNYAAPMSVADVAAHVGISPNHAMSLFRRVVGMSIKGHLTRIRLSHAQMMLANTEKKVVSIAMDSGFGSLSSFYDAFQMHMQVTPAEFRKEARQ